MFEKECGRKQREILSAAAEISGRVEMKIFSTTFNTGSIGTELLDERGKLRRMLQIRYRVVFYLTTL